MDRGYTIVNNSIFDDINLRARERWVYVVYISFYNEKFGYAYPTIQQMLDRTGYTSDRDLLKITNSLIEKGYVIKQCIKRKNRYYLPKLDNLQNVGDLQNVGHAQVEGNSDLQNVGDCDVQNVGTTNTTINTTTNTMYLEIFNHWNNEGVTKLRRLTKEIEKSIDKALKIRKDDGLKLTIDDIKKSISNYAEVYNKGCFTYQWTLKDFLTRKQRDTEIPQLLLFMDNGTSYINAKKLKSKIIPINHKESYREEIL